MATDARQRMIQAAAELFGQSGYHGTSVDQIAARAGVTQRTFFRHFGDKGEVLFSETDPLLHVLVAAIESAPAEEALLDITVRALHALADALQPRRADLRARAALIATEPALRERELLKLDRWHRALVTSLEDRGIPRRQAMLVTAIGNAAWTTAYESWVTDRARTSLRRRVDDAFVALGAHVTDAQVTARR